MINLQSLRLGNAVIAAGRIHIVRSLSDCKYDPIKLIDLHGSKMEVDGPGKLEPVPYTREIDRLCDTELLDALDMEIFTETKTGNSVIMVCNEFVITEDIKWLHQLQNIHHALTEKEMPIAWPPSLH